MTRSVPRQWATRLATYFAVAVLSSCTTWVWAPPLFRPTPPPPAPLTAGLTGKWEDINTEFDRRVREAFPVGIPVGQMATALRRQGFHRNDWSTSSEEDHDAVRREDNFVCNIGAYVHWKNDDEYRVTAIWGVYREEGCL